MCNFPCICIYRRTLVDSSGLWLLRAHLYLKDTLQKMHNEDKSNDLDDNFTSESQNAILSVTKSPNSGKKKCIIIGL